MNKQAKDILRKNKKEIIYLVLIITTIFIVDQIIYTTDYNHLNYTIIKTIYNLIKGFINLWISLVIIYISMQNITGKTVNLKEFIIDSLSDIKQILCVYAIQFIILIIVSLFTIPIISTIIVQALLVFVWQVYLIDNKRKLEVFTVSVSVVFSNINKVIKYIMMYFGVLIMMALINLLPIKMEYLEKGFIIMVQYFGVLILNYLTIMFTIIYMEIKENKTKQSALS
ncbi:hypothetical protein [Vallitalea guaymasensis]|uniref:Uncharacterized protein n=1 Tax=Vallitalea guaymasensis TaxID=1185412 RepID=A0A8J8SBM6_9FIRM|nr:hypothetical protein [Vallitalea guaymasensis]QUH28511.1 hypothetical protein HYG85_06050 [Vallitalea guaymasensis]